ncbi:phosphate/phosphite/phosphonate ABC transporter substrate-binding protein [Kaarinaea lacus]
MQSTVLSYLLSHVLVKPRKSFYFISVLSFNLFAFVPASYADLILTAPPRETPEAGKVVYAPLAKYLSQFLGEPVIYEHPLNWKRYEKKMKNDEYDIIFDGPHFAAWRIETQLAKPLIKLPGALRFVLVVKKSETALHEISNMIGKTICTLPAPNLGALTLFSMFPYPARQPEYLLIKGGFKEIRDAFTQGKCDGAILRSSYYFKKADQIFRDTTRVIKRSKGLTNQGITISRRVDPDNYQKLVNSLVRGEGKSALKPILERFYSNANAFIPASSVDYRNHNLLRDTVIYGW